MRLLPIDFVVFDVIGFKLEDMFFDKQLFSRRPDVLLHSSGGLSCIDKQEKSS